MWKAVHSSIMRLAGIQDLLRSNTAANAGATARAKGTVDVAELTWGQLQLPAGWEQPDIVLAADLVHDNLYMSHMTTRSFLLLAGYMRYSILLIRMSDGFESCIGRCITAVYTSRC